MSFQDCLERFPLSPQTEAALGTIRALLLSGVILVSETYIQDTMDEMISLTKTQVPNYLVGSEFYNSLSADDEEEFCIPRKFLKPTVSVASGAELAHLFHTIKFWGVMSLPSNLIDLLIFKSVVIPECEKESVREVLLEFDTEFKLSQLYDTLPVCSSMEQRLHTAVQCGRQDVLEDRSTPLS